MHRRSTSQLRRRWPRVAVSDLQVDSTRPSASALLHRPTGRTTRSSCCTARCNGSLERFVGIYIEHTGAEFPVLVGAVQAGHSRERKAQEYAKARWRPEGCRVPPHRPARQEAGREDSNAELLKIRTCWWSARATQKPARSVGGKDRAPGAMALPACSSASAPRSGQDALTRAACARSTFATRFQMLESVPGSTGGAGSTSVGARMTSTLSVPLSGPQLRLSTASIDAGQIALVDQGSAGRDRFRRRGAPSHASCPRISVPDAPRNAGSHGTQVALSFRRTDTVRLLRRAGRTNQE